ncbi:hypothetical protein [Paraburkholderia sp. D1E]|uniref:hypothetical protein n=1 Tax=Paraburkholderia sp. D1E TaxID=3461398 RepID=UPI00404554AA
MLDCYIGRMHRLVAESPHIAELTTSREALATQPFQTLDGQIRALQSAVLSEADIDRDEAVAMFIAAGLGTLQTGDAAAQPYRGRLSAMVDTLVAGLAYLAKA